MAISFNSIPNNIRVPLFYIEVDPSRAGTSQVDGPVILPGEMSSVGTSSPDLIVPVSSVGSARSLFGPGSPLARTAEKYLELNSAQQLFCQPLAELASGTASTGTIVIAASSAVAGTIPLYVAGQKVAVSVSVGQTATQIGDALVSAIGANSDLPVTAVNSTGSVALTAKWKGISGNDITLRNGYYGLAGGEETPSGVTVTITAMASGAGVPSLIGGIAAFADDRYDYNGFPFTDATSLNAIRDEFSFADSGRWGWIRQLYGHIFAAKRGSYSDLLSFGLSRNDGIISTLSLEAKTPAPFWEVIGSLTARVSRSLQLDPARPLQTLTLPNILPAARGERFTWSERNALLNSGMATQTVNKAGEMQIERLITMYQTNSFGQNDDALLDVQTLATSAYVQREMARIITTKFPRHKLANNGTRFGAGQAIVTPNIVKAELVAFYRDLEDRGLVENGDIFKNNLIVERNAGDPTRLDVQFPADYVNQLRVFAVQNQFRLEYNRLAA